MTLIDEARELLAGATPGDWDLVASELWEITVPERFDPVAIVHEDGDAALIAAAPRIIAGLIEEVERLTAADRLLDLDTPEAEVDAACITEGLDPAALRERGAAFGAALVEQTAIARAEAAEAALAEVDMILSVVGADRDFRRLLLCAARDRTKAVEAKLAQLEGEQYESVHNAEARDHWKAVAESRPEVTAEDARSFRDGGCYVKSHAERYEAACGRIGDALRAHAAKAVRR